MSSVEMSVSLCGTSHVYHLYIKSGVSTATASNTKYYSNEKIKSIYLKTYDQQMKWTVTVWTLTNSVLLWETIYNLQQVNALAAILSLFLSTTDPNMFLTLQACDPTSILDHSVKITLSDIDLLVVVLFMCAYYLSRNPLSLGPPWGHLFLVDTFRCSCSFWEL